MLLSFTAWEPGGRREDSPTLRNSRGGRRVSLVVSWIRHPGRALDAYIDGELDGAQTDRVVAHLAKCWLCRQRAAVTRQIRRSLQAMAHRVDP
ncbi:MAG: anti-sigma factor family protein [Acidimicrobiales bacterium]